MDSNSTDNRSWRLALLLRRADQVTLAVIVVIAFCAILVHWYYQVTIGDRLIEIDRAAPFELEFHVQVNEADEAELMLLPGIGPVLAQRIVVERKTNGPYTSPDQMERVKGIGPKTVRRLSKFVRFD